jgi:hypothetical protein
MVEKQNTRGLASLCQWPLYYSRLKWHGNSGYHDAAMILYRFFQFSKTPPLLRAIAIALIVAVAKVTVKATISSRNSGAS